MGAGSASTPLPLSTQRRPSSSWFRGCVLIGESAGSSPLLLAGGVPVGGAAPSQGRLRRGGRRRCPSAVMARSAGRRRRAGPRASPPRHGEWCRPRSLAGTHRAAPSLRKRGWGRSGDGDPWSGSQAWGRTEVQRVREPAGCTCAGRSGGAKGLGTPVRVARLASPVGSTLPQCLGMRAPGAEGCQRCLRHRRFLASLQRVLPSQG